MFASLSRPLSWWLDGLVEAALARAESRAGQTRLRLVSREDGFDLVAPGGARAAATRIGWSSTGELQLPAAAAALIRGRDVDVLLAPDEVLVRRLDPLPAESLPYLDGVVRHHLERVTPWVQADVLHAYTVRREGGQDRPLLVTLAATARSIHAGVIASLRRVGAGKIRFLAIDPVAGTFAMPLDGTGATAARRGALRRRVVLAASAAGVVATIAAGAFAYSWASLDWEVAAFDEAIAARRQVLLAAAAPRDAAGKPGLERMLAEKRVAPSAVLALEQLSDLLPDGTFVAEFHIAEGRARISGVTRSVAELLPLLERSPIFADAAFAGPTTRLQDGQGDRFSIEMRVVAPTGAEK